MGGNKKNIMNGILLGTLIVVTFAILLKDQDLDEVFTALKLASWPILIIAAILGFSRIVGEAISIYLAVNALNEKVDFMNCMKYSVIGFFFCAITPSASGGQPAQVYYMKKDKLPVSKTSLSLVIITIAYRGTLLLFGFLAFILYQIGAFDTLGNVRYLFFLGMLINFVIFVSLTLLLYTKKAMAKIGTYLIEILAKLKIIRHKEEKLDRLLSLIIRYHESADFMKKNKMVTIGIFLINLTQRVAMFSVTYMIYLSFGMEGHSLIEIALLQSIVSVCADMLPLPGGVGASEQCYMLVFQNVFTQSLLIPSMLLFRGISFYLLVVISAITLIALKLKESYHVKKPKVPLMLLSTIIVSAVLTGCTVDNQTDIEEQNKVATSQDVNDNGSNALTDDGTSATTDESNKYPDNAIFNSGNTVNLDSLFQRAQAGEELTIGFIGGSITMGSGASKQENCYANRIFQWFETNFPEAKFTYVNAGIGATDSLFGCARVEEDLLAYDPDFVIVEFSVNDSNNTTYGESYESLVRKILLDNEDVALVLLYMAQFDNGTTAQGVHFSTGNYYSLPQISLFASVYQEIVSGNMVATDLSKDMLHPNDMGHEVVASLVTNYLDKVKNGDYGTMEKVAIPESNKFLVSVDSIRYNKKNLEPILNGFVEDTAEQLTITDIFKNGYYGKNEGDSIIFTVTGSRISLQYRKTNTNNAPTAIAIIDGDEKNPVALDGNYPNGWGDWIYLHDIFSGEDGEHTVEIRLTSSGEKDFYFVSAIVR